MAIITVSVSTANPLAKTTATFRQVEDPVKPRRRVSFDETRNVTYPNSLWSLDECKPSWYSAEELFQIKTEVCTLAKFIWRKERGNTCSDTYLNTILRVYDSCRQAKRETSQCLFASCSEQARLVKQVHKSCIRTGLERMYIRDIAIDRQERRQQIVQMVLGMQKSTRYSPERVRAELIRLSIENLSRASRLFARHLALALELAELQE